MKYVFIFLFSFFASNFFSQSESPFWQDADNFFKNNVSAGLVDYASIQENPVLLTQLIQDIKAADKSYLQNKAFLINAYNLLVIHKIVQNYPIASPQDVEGFFTKKDVKLCGETYAINDIENTLIRPVFEDARVHFALVCGAIGCPAITNYAYRPEEVEKQLENKTKETLNDSNFIKLDSDSKELAISEIFKWYAADFKSNTSDVKSFIAQYRTVVTPADYKLTYYTYDWQLNEQKSESTSQVETARSNVQTYTPSVILKKGQVELSVFNNLYTQTAFRTGERERVDLSSRDSYYGLLLQGLYGVSKSGRVNVGLDVNIKSVFIDPSKGSPTNLFAFSGAANEQRTAVTALGPKIKINPFKKLNNLSIQSAFWVPMAQNSESDAGSQPWLDYERFTSWTQFFYDKPIGTNWQLFLEMDLLFRFAKPAKFYDNNLPKTNTFGMPTSVFLSYFLSGKTTLYAMTQYAPTIEYNAKVGPGIVNASDYAQAGVGLKYQLSRSLNLELLYTNFFTSANGGAGNTFNLGVKFIR